MEKCSRVVILGAGFGGLTTAARLSALRDGDECRTTLIERQTRHLYTPLLYEVATGYFSEEGHDVAPPIGQEPDLKTGAAVVLEDLKPYFERKGTSIAYEEVMGVDWTTREVLLSDDRRIGFDHLVVAVGGVVDFYGIPGLQEHAHPMYTLKDGLAIRRHLYGLIEKRKRNELPEIRILIGGAGPAGVEFAGELAMLMRRLIGRGVLTPSDVTIELIEANNRPLPTFHKDMSAWARRRLESLGVKLLLDTCIKGAHRDHVVLSPRPLRQGERTEDLVCDFRKESEKEVTTDLLVWCGGVKANPLIAKLGMNLDRRGRIETEPTLQVRGRKDAWALGDCASLVDPKTKMPVPPLAQAAIKQGRIAAGNILRAVRGEPLEAYGFPHMQAIVPIGGMYGLAEVYGARFRGWIVGLLHLAADARYFFATFPFAVAWNGFWTGFWAFSRNDAD